MCGAVFKGFALVCHDMKHRQGVCHTRSIVANVTTPQVFSLAPHSHSLSPSSCLSGNCIIWPYRGIWNAAEQHLLAEPNRYANLFHSRRFDKLDCSSWKASFRRRAAATNPYSRLSLSLHLLLPPPSIFFSTFSVPSPAQLVSICRALPLKIEKGSWPATTNLKRTGEEKIPLF